MADTKANIKVPPGAWLDLYAAAAIPVGSRISVENVGVCDVLLAVQASRPETDRDSYNIVKREGDPLANTQGDSGAWAFCGHAAGKLNVSAL